MKRASLRNVEPKAVRYGGRGPTADALQLRDAFARSSFAWGLQATGDRWSVVVLRAAFLGAKTFEQFRKQLGIPRQTLSDRLRYLTDIGVFQPHIYQSNPPRHQYSLTAKGRRLYPTILMTWSWRRKWFADVDALPRLLTHIKCGQHFRPVCVCAGCRQIAHLNGMDLRINTSDRRPVQLARSRRLSIGGRHDLVADDVLAFGLGVDRWAQSIVLMLMLGSRHFEELQTILGIGSNILSNRLAMMCDCGLLVRQPDQEDGRRHFYRLTPMSEDLFCRLATLADWLRVHEPTSVESLHAMHIACGKPFRPLVLCSGCNEPVRASDVAFQY